MNSIHSFVMVLSLSYSLERSLTACRIVSLHLSLCLELGDLVEPEVDVSQLAELSECLLRIVLAHDGLCLEIWKINHCA